MPILELFEWHLWNNTADWLKLGWRHWGQMPPAKFCSIQNWAYIILFQYPRWLPFWNFHSTSPKSYKRDKIGWFRIEKIVTFLYPAANLIFFKWHLPNHMSDLTETWLGASGKHGFLEVIKSSRWPHGGHFEIIQTTSTKNQPKHDGWNKGNCLKGFRFAKIFPSSYPRWPQTTFPRKYKCYSSLCVLHGIWFLVVEIIFSKHSLCGISI